MGIRAWLRSWRRRRTWTLEMQLEHLRQLVMADHRWLAHDKTASALTERYLAALAPDWMSRTHMDVCHFRREIGLEPNHAWRDFGSPEHLQRLDRIARGKPKFADGPLPERGWD